MGPYNCLRAAMRRRGWVEKFLNAPLPADIARTSHIAMRNKAVRGETADDDGMCIGVWFKYELHSFPYLCPLF